MNNFSVSLLYPILSSSLWPPTSSVFPRSTTIAQPVWCATEKSSLLLRRSDSRAFKHDPEFPVRAVDYCLREGGIEAKDLHCVGFYDKSLLTFERLLETHLGTAPLGLRLYWKSMKVWLEKKLWIPQLIQEQLCCDVPVLFGDHHESHAASAFYPSPYREAAIVTLDGVGEWTTTSYGYGRDAEIHTLADIKFPPLAGSVLFGLYLFCGLQGQLRRIQADGVSPLWRAKIRQSNAR